MSKVSFVLISLVLALANGAPVGDASTKVAPVPAKPVADEKKVLNEKELKAEIANLQHVSPKTGKFEAPVKEAKVEASHAGMDVEKLRKSVFGSESFQKKVQVSCAHKATPNCATEAGERLFCALLRRSHVQSAEEVCSNAKTAPALVQIESHLRHTRKAPEDELAKEMTHDLEMNFNKIAPFGKEDTAKELQDHAAKTQDTLVDAVENAEVAEIKRAVFRALTRLRAATIKEFDTIARLETQAIDAYNDAHHYRAENPLSHLHDDEAAVPTDKLKSFH